MNRLTAMKRKRIFWVTLFTVIVAVCISIAGFVDAGIVLAVVGLFHIAYLFSGRGADDAKSNDSAKDAHEVRLEKIFWTKVLVATTLLIAFCGAAIIVWSAVPLVAPVAAICMTVGLGILILLCRRHNVIRTM